MDVYDFAIFGLQRNASHAKESEISLGGKTLGCQALQMALRKPRPQSIMLQAEILWNKKPSMPSDDPLSFLLHHALSLLLARPKRRPWVEMERKHTNQLGRT